MKHGNYKIITLTLHTEIRSIQITIYWDNLNTICTIWSIYRLYGNGQFQTMITRFTALTKRDKGFFEWMFFN